ncbi:polysaccharide biosynthesis protein [Legionella taurinensis]|uniref:Polysaccharide biosynthesis protein n=1 Tax=Legionella taurinensis TaxID=70611 RepID=A0AB38N6W7_9GAMM|nr:nucleoside-diphosphate sugar epimerase/dehydratase [Legionella taurinensis]MDX1836721.1 nucleoside-diphosphate sugar epimerase/dehydratase [Legionella taurinensis]PUT42825.1 polysaccharide biosynthesis protein [Legionella taurinensis]PUT45380.1 polysaccharide biosynthesis protein [Legionella taurinensis]PUT47045.1 polysaccharide biosynthesis protein [Legionella taurinensis]PUT49147.1 polysaccharide biosynthesis protein [Legionella taurinensis]
MSILGGLLSKVYKKLPSLMFDIAAIPAAWYFAYWLRYNLQPFPHHLTSIYAVAALLLLMTIQVGCYYYCKVYRGLWRFTSINDVIRIIKATLLAIGLVIPVFYLTSLLQHVPRSILPMYALGLVTLLCGGRLVMRMYRDRKGREDMLLETKRVLVIGAGHAGEGLLRDLKKMNAYSPVGLVDDNPGKRGMEIHGVRVLGSVRELPQLVVNHQIDLLFIAIPSARSAAMRRIVDYCSRSRVPFRTLPGISALVNDQIGVKALREVSIEDLLGRDQVQLEWDRIAGAIRGKKVIVTGGGGSIGEELCRQVMAHHPAQLLIIDNSEFNLYKADYELRDAFPEVPLLLRLTSITDASAIDAIFHQFKPDLVFHAAAYKHVPLLEDQVRVAVQNNILGTQVVALASAEAGAEKFVLISSDKAVNPTNVMGTTKRVAEIYCQNLNERVKTQFITVRFGNVLGSAGSVVPLFQKQLDAGGPLTVTHPDIQRYFMTIPEACQLILQAMVNGQGGEIFVLDMGEPIKISYLAEQMIRLAGKEPGKDIAIKYTGLRPGEKLFEELFHESEQLANTEHEKLFKARFRKIDWRELLQTLRLMNDACQTHNHDELHVLLKSLVPEFTTRFETPHESDCRN